MAASTPYPMTRSLALVLLGADFLDVDPASLAYDVTPDDLPSTESVLTVIGDEVVPRASR